MFSDPILLDKLGPVCDVIVLFHLCVCLILKRHVALRDQAASNNTPTLGVLSAAQKPTAGKQDCFPGTPTQVHTEFNHHTTQHTTIVASP